MNLNRHVHHITEYIENIKMTDFKYIVIVFFFLPYLIGVFWPTYLLLGIHTIVRLKKEYIEENLFFICLIFCILTFKFFQSPSTQSVLLFKAFAGLYFFYFYFKYINNVNFTKILLGISCVLIIYEFYSKMIYIPDFFQQGLATAFPRPMGIGENATITSVILISFMIVYFNKIRFYLKSLLVVSVVVSCSGMGFLGLLYVFYLKKIKTKFKPIYLILLMIVSLACYFAFYIKVRSTLYMGNPVYKISPEYIKALVIMKYMDLKAIFSQLSFGEHIYGLTWGNHFFIGGDFGWRDIYQMCGVIGVLFYIILIQKICKNREVTFFVLLSMLHYGFVWWPGGQIFMGYLFARMAIEDSSIKSETANVL